MRVAHIRFAYLIGAEDGACVEEQKQDAGCYEALLAARCEETISVPESAHRSHPLQISSDHRT